MLRRMLFVAATLVLAACSGKQSGSEAAQQQAADIVHAQVAASGGLPGSTVKIKGYDAKGCTDKAKALELIAAAKLDDKSKFLKLYGEGMKDESCRGFADGLPVKVVQKDGDLTCIAPGDDPQKKQCLWIESSSF